MTRTDIENKKVKLLIRSLGCSVWPEFGPNGNCPVQAEGRIALPNRKPVRYYFRSRGLKTRMGFHINDPIFSTESFIVEEISAEKYAAGWLTTTQALKFIHKAVNAWKFAKPSKPTHG